MNFARAKKKNNFLTGPSTPLASVYQKASPSAPILPLPVTLKFISTSHQSKLVAMDDQMEPFWLRRDGVMRTLSSEAIASEKEGEMCHVISP